MKIFITGATGFIGTHTVKRLAHSGHNLYCMCRNNSNVKSPKIDMLINNKYDGMNKASIWDKITGPDPKDIDLSKEITMKLKFSSASDYKSLTTKPDEIKDLFMIIHYKLG